jgi:diadenosine tetraphosphate (Ap4A) HIT family hydrolase
MIDKNYNNKCIFCKIVKGELPSVKIWEDSKHIAVLGNHPNTEGMTLVLTKKHFDSYAFDMPEKEYKDLMGAAKKVAKLLDKKLKVQRTSMIMEGMGINHVHIKLYPLHGLNEKFKEMWGDKEVYFDKYEGYVTTLEGPKKSIEELNKIKEKILN